MKEYLKNQKVGKRKTRKSPLVRTLGFCSVILGGTTILGGIDFYLSIPVSYQAKNLNGDNRPDLIVKNRRGEQFEYIQMEDGRYRLLAPGEKEAIEREARMQFYLDNNVPFSSDDL